MLLRSLTVFILFSHALFSHYHDGDRNGNLSLIHLESASSAIIDGCVNAITGEFFQSTTDLKIAGVEPLYIERYLSDKLSFKYDEREWKNFGFNFASKMYAGGQVFVRESNGGTLDMQFVRKNGDEREHHLNPNHVKFGVTNFSGEQIGRKNHIRFIKAFLDKKETKGTVEYSNGIKRTYEKIKLNQNRNLLPTKEKYPSGAYHEYNYINDYGLSKVTLKAPNGEFLSSLDFKYPSKKELQANPYFDVIASNGQSVRYHLTVEKKSVWFDITRVEKSHAPDETIKIKYKDLDKQMIRVRRPESRYRETHLYTHGWQLTRNGPLQIKRDETNAKNAQMWVGKVHQLKAPVGVDDSAIMTYEFTYWTPLFHDIGTNQIFSGKGCTTVFDAHAHKTCYHWNDKFQLERIEKFAGTQNHVLHSTEYFVYDNAGQLTERYFDKTYEGIVFSRQFFYNEHGDVIEDKLWGNLTGRQVDKKVQRGGGGPVNNGADAYSKFYRYTSDRFHNIAYETDGFCETFFEYQPNTDILTAKFTGGLTKIEAREFYQYNGRGELTSKITDDGCGRDVNDYQGVTLRRIERKEHSNGFPVKVEEFFCDLESGCEVLNSKQCIRYNATGKPLEEQHFDGNGEHLYTVHMEYDAHDNVILATDPLGVVTRFAYDENDNMILQEREGIQKRNTYDFVNRLIKEEIIGEDGYQSQSYRYNHLNQKIAATDQWGNETTFSYDDFGRPIAEHSPAYLGGDSVVVSPVIRRTYDVIGNLTTLVTPSGYHLQSAYTIRGDLIESWDNEGTLQRCEYSINGLLLKKRERSGLESRYTYDFMGRVLREELYDPSGNFVRAVSSTYKGGLKVSDTDSAGIVTFYTYNFRGQCIKKTTADAAIFFEYDTQGRISCERQADSVKSTTYDFFNRVTEESVDGILKRKNYDAHGRVFMEQSGEAIISTKYNALGLPVEVTDAEGRTVYTSFNDDFVNSLGQRVRLVTHTHPNGTRTEIEYNSHGKVARQTTLSPLSDTLQHVVNYYDANEKLSATVTTVIAANKPSYERKLCLQYDPQGRIVCLRDAADSLEQKTTSYFYNTLGQKTCEMQANDIALSYSYDPLGRLASLASSDATVDYRYTYDSRDNLLQVDDAVYSCSTEKGYDLFNRLTYEKLANGLTLHYSYDEVGRLTTMTLPDDSVVSYGYRGSLLHTVTKGNYTHTYTERNLSGKSIVETLPFGETRTTTFASTGQKLEIIAPGFSDKVIERDVSGNVVKRSLQNDMQNFQWDCLHQLSRENDLKYIHDSVYNRTQIGGTDYAINLLNQVVSDGKNTYQYDTNGNLIEGRGLTLEYDGLNRLTAATTATGTVRYRYDAENRRISTVGAETTHYYYLGMNELGSVSPSGTSLRVFGESEGAERGAGVLFELNGEVIVPLYDLLGNVAALRDASGKVVEEYRYDLFGVQSLADAGGGKSPWRYSSKRMDIETGFIYFGHRYYAPTLGRWATADPKGYAAGPNLYAYVMNNPIAHMDQYGLEAEDSGSSGGQSIRKVVRFGKKLLTPGALKRTFLNFPKLRESIKFTIEKITSKIDSRFRETDDNEVLLYKFNTGKEPNGFFIVFINGICNSLNDAIDSAALISAMHNGVSVYILHNPTRGALKDVIEAAALKCSFYTPTCKKIEGEMRQLFGMFSDKHCVAYAHSKGALILDRVLHRLSTDMRKHTFAITFGGAHVIDPKGLAGALNFVSNRDGVPMICSGLMLMKNLFSQSDHLQILEGTGWFGIDHEFASPTYQKQLKKAATFIQNQFGD